MFVLYNNPRRVAIQMYQSEMREGFLEDYLRSRFVARTSLNSLFKKTQPFLKIEKET